MNKQKKENKMNNRDIIGIALVGIMAVTAFFITEPVGASAVRLLGKAVWYLPYVLLLGAVRCFKAR